MFNWSKSGITVVSNEVLEKREDACLSCEHLVKPEKLLQKLVTSKSKDTIGKRAADCVCKVCGCSISKKIRAVAEGCPVTMPVCFGARPARDHPKRASFLKYRFQRFPQQVIFEIFSDDNAFGINEYI